MMVSIIHKELEVLLKGGGGGGGGLLERGVGDLIEDLRYLTNELGLQHQGRHWVLLLSVHL